jgi:hypothetical protein
MGLDFENLYGRNTISNTVANPRMEEQLAELHCRRCSLGLSVLLPDAQGFI